MKVKPLGLLNRTGILGDASQNGFQKAPVKILQIGEGNFLRGFLCFMVQRANETGIFDGSIVMTPCRPMGQENLVKLQNQDLLYTVFTRGLLDGKVVRKAELISVISQTVDPYTNWQDFLALAASESLEFVVSNTTEAGLRYVETPWRPDAPMLSYPAKLTMFLYQRFQCFQGSKEKGLAIFPCELLERNGDLLKSYVLQYIKYWDLSDEFYNWVTECNIFLNSLVDRIVPGFPGDEAENVFRELGYADALLTCAEPYYIWAIERQGDVESRFPLQQAELNVQWVDDLTPFHTKKVRILNGLHTLMAPLGVLSGLSEVREVLADQKIGPLIQYEAVSEIVDTLTYPESESLAYANCVLERFQNPYIHHQLLDITLNSLTKFRIRLLPTLVTSFGQHGNFPKGVVLGLAGLLRLYKVTKVDSVYQGTKFNGDRYPVKDEPDVLDYFSEIWAQYERRAINLETVIHRILRNERLWGRNLGELSGLDVALKSALQELDPSLT